MVPRMKASFGARAARGVAAAVALAVLGGPGFAGPAAATTRAVPGDYTTLRDALDASAAGDSVVVSGGTYRERALHLPAGVTLRGRPGDPVIVEARGRGRHLDVDAGGDCVVESIRFHAGSTPSRDDPDGGSLRVAAGASLTLRDCSFDSTSAFHDGGAIHAGAGTSLTLERCSFERSQAFQKVTPSQARRKRLFSSSICKGGVLYLEARSRLTATDCRFSDYQAKDAGGAIFLGKDGVVRLTDCEFRDGTSLAGGTLTGEHTDVRLTRCRFRGSVTTPTFREPARGGAIRLTDGGTLSLVDCSFVDNRSDQGGAVAVNNLDRVVITGCEFFHNSAAAGGAVTAGLSPLEIEGCVFSRNSAGPGNGGAVLSAGGPITCQSSTFHANSAIRSGSALDISGPVATLLDRCIVADSEGGSPIGRSSGPVIELTCCNLHGNEGGDWSGEIADQAGRNGNFSLDPGFRNPASGDFTLAETSPCLDAPECGRIGAQGGASP